MTDGPPVRVRPIVKAAGPLRQRLDAAEAALARESAALAEIDAALNDPALYVRRAGEVGALAERRSRLVERVARAEAAWLAAAEAYEASDADA